MPKTCRLMCLGHFTRLLRHPSHHPTSWLWFSSEIVRCMVSCVAASVPFDVVHRNVRHHEVASTT